MKFRICSVCGNVIMSLNNEQMPVKCCNQVMQELVPNTKEAAVEKHKPVIVEENGEKYIVVGSTLHPSTEEHHIEWIVVDYGTSYQVYNLEATSAPKVKLVNPEGIKDIYAYCNLHGLWKMYK